MNYPNCEKLAANQEKIQAIRNFINFMEDLEFRFASFYGEEGNQMDTDYRTLKQRIYEFLEIEPDELEKERQHILDNV